VHGLKQAGNNWYICLHDDLMSIGFHQSQVDKCLFIRDNCIIIVYVDDCLIFSPNDKTLAEIIHQPLTIAVMHLDNSHGIIVKSLGGSIT
jgi:hypothetical protein